MSAIINAKAITIQKNRGWRGLAEAELFDQDGKSVNKMIFSFSQPMWLDMLGGYMVFQDKEHYYIVEFNNLEKLPSLTQQRSVLIKNFKGNVLSVTSILKEAWTRETGTTYAKIRHFLLNRNNHTTSDWNYIGVRVVPDI